MSEDLIHRARSGDEAALRQLYEAHRPRVMRLAFALLGDSDDAEDVMQDVMVYALSHLEGYDSNRAAFGTWLHIITVSRCRDRVRRVQTRLKHLARWFTEHRHEPPTLDAHLDRLDAASRVGAALDRLSTRQREALVLREMEGLTFKEMGQVLGVPLRTAQARVAAAHAALRRVLLQAEAGAQADVGAHSRADAKKRSAKADDPAPADRPPPSLEGDGG